MQALSRSVPLSFDHGADYTQVAQRRPEMALELAAIDGLGALLGHVKTSVLVDSGADTTTLNEDLAALLGLDVSTMPEVIMTGVGNTQIKVAYSDQVLAHLCGKWIRLPVLFQKGRSPNLLGRSGAFDSMYLAFAHRHSLMLAIAT